MISTGKRVRSAIKKLPRIDCCERIEYCDVGSICGKIALYETKLHRQIHPASNVCWVDLDFAARAFPANISTTGKRRTVADYWQPLL
jgi:hypothetical protein